MTVARPWRASWVGVWLLIVAACQTREPVPEYDGRNLFLGYCASCHGAEGAGDGPVAAAMKRPMADLRTLHARHGAFPRDWLLTVIDGRTLHAAHGTPDMPVWGWQFHLAVDSEADVAARIDALVDYIERIQR